MPLGPSRNWCWFKMPFKGEKKQWLKPTSQCVQLKFTANDVQTDLKVYRVLNLELKIIYSWWEL
jgi:hypothetical protein